MIVYSDKNHGQPYLNEVCEIAGEPVYEMVLPDIVKTDNNKSNLIKAKSTDKQNNLSEINTVKIDSDYTELF